MLLFIIFGTRGITSTKQQGQFHCPRCGESHYCLKSVRRFFTLYFIPIIPLDHLGEYVECSSCQGTYDPQILDYDPSQANTELEAQFGVAMKQAMISMILADGMVKDAEVLQLQSIFQHASGAQVTLPDLREEIDVVRNKGSEALDILSEIANNLSDSGREMIVRAAYQVAAANGHVSDKQSELLKSYGDTLGMSNAHFNGVLSEVAAALEGPPQQSLPPQ